MQLSGLLAAALRDPGLARVRDLARTDASPDDLDLTAPPAMRPSRWRRSPRTSRKGAPGGRSWR